MLEEKLIFSLNSSLKQIKQKGIERERLWNDFLRKQWAPFITLKVSPKVSSHRCGISFLT